MSKLTPVQFFYEYAGWSYQPSTETPEQGRQRSAQRLADAEAWARSVGAEYEWEGDWDVDHLETCEYAVMRIDGEEVASLGCIDDADDNCRRVVEAELALEAMPTDAATQEPLPLIFA